MGYVDGETMIKFKNKMIKKFNHVNKNLKNTFVVCELNNKVNISNFKTIVRLFKNKKRYDKDGDHIYSIAIGQPKRVKLFNYHTKRNGNGVIASNNDYLHQRKKYLNYILPNGTLNLYPSLQDLLTFLLGNNILHSYFRSDMSIVSSVDFPGLDEKNCRNLRITLNVNYDLFMTALSDPANEVNLVKYFLKHTGTLEGNEFTRYRGKLYIVKDQFMREGNSHTKFCKEIFGYLHLIISINKINISTTQINISTLKDK